MTATTTDTPNKPKRACSPEKMAANRRNSARSTGPKTQQGKQVSRFNNLRHGAAARLGVLPGEDPEVRDRRIEDWTQALNPANAVERYMIETAVDASLCKDRAKVAEVAALTRNIHSVDEGHDGRKAAEVAALVERLGEDPAVIRQLRDSVQGCRWLSEQWYALDVQIAEAGYLEPSHRVRGVLLMGKRPGDVFDDPAVGAWVSSALATLHPHGDTPFEHVSKQLDADFPEDMDHHELLRRIKQMGDALPVHATAVKRLAATVGAAREELAERLDLVSAREERDRRLAMEAARCDTSAAGTSRLKYTMSHDRAMIAALRELRALQASRPAEGDAADLLDEPTTPAEAPAAEAPSIEEDAAPTEPTVSEIDEESELPGNTSSVVDESPEGGADEPEAEAEAGEAGSFERVRVSRISSRVDLRPVMVARKQGRAKVMRKVKAAASHRLFSARRVLDRNPRPGQSLERATLPETGEIRRFATPA